MATDPSTPYETADGSRRYAYPGRVRGLPSVTAITKQAWPAAHLERWRLGNVARALVNDAAETARRFERLAAKPPPMRVLHAEKLRDDLMDLREDHTAADRGTRIHAAVERRLVHGKQSAWDADLDAPDERDCATGAVRAIRRMGLTPHEVEVTVYGRDPIRYAGTADLLATDLTGRWCIADLKTGRRVSRAWLPQVAAYAGADEWWDGEQLQYMPPVERALILHARPDAVTWYEVDLAYALGIWRACALIATAAKAKRGLAVLNET